MMNSTSPPQTPDFWLTSGWHLCDRNDSGGLLASADFMAAYFHRPELALVEESCAAETALHEQLTSGPFAEVTEEQLAALADPDVAHNYRAVLAFRQFIAQHDTLQSAYMAIARGAPISFPPLFVDQLAQIILREILTEESDPMQIRAAEMLFRSQSVTTEDGRIMIADQSVVQLQADYQRSLQQTERPEEVQIDILTSENKQVYWERSDRFDTSIDIAFTQPGLDALARVLEKWIAHFLDLPAVVTPLVKIEDDNWRWHVGLDSNSTGILNDLYDGKQVAETRLREILCLFQLSADSGLKAEMNGQPVYLGLAMNAAGIVSAKPQNLLVNLPLSDA